MRKHVPQDTASKNNTHSNSIAMEENVAYNLTIQTNDNVAYGQREDRDYDYIAESMYESIN